MLISQILRMSHFLALNETQYNQHFLNCDDALAVVISFTVRAVAEFS